LESLSLEGVKAVSAAVLTPLLHIEEDEYRCITLTGLTTMDGDVAQTFVDAGEHIYLGELAELTLDAAAILAKSELGLTLGIPNITDEQSLAFATHKGSLDLNGLKTVSDTAVANLSKHCGDSLSISGLTEITAEQAKHLSTHKGYLSLDDISTISADAAALLIKHEGNLHLGYGWREELPSDIVAILNQHPSLYETDFNDGEGGVADIPQTLIDSLSALGIKGVELEYDASGDDGEGEIGIKNDDGWLVESGYHSGDDLGQELFTSFDKEDDVTEEHCQSVCNTLETFLWNALPSGFEQEFGSTGTAVIDVDGGSITVSHAWREEDPYADDE
jgi:hypothetical protein